MRINSDDDDNGECHCAIGHYRRSRVERVADGFVSTKPPDTDIKGDDGRDLSQQRDDAEISPDQCRTALLGAFVDARQHHHQERRNR